MSSVSMSSLIVLYIGICLLFSLFSYEVKRYTKIPAYITLLLWGFVIEEFIPSSGLFSEMIDMLLHSKPGLYRYAFLPILIFNSAYSSNYHAMKTEKFQILILSSTVLVGCSGLTAVSLEYVFGYKFLFRKLFIFGLVMSATDNLIFNSITKDIHISGALRSLICGETMLNYANVFVIFEVLLNNSSGREGFESGLVLFLRLVFGGLTLGLCFSLAHILILRNILNDFIAETNLTLVSAYLLYWICEYDKVHFSGSFALVVYGVFMSAYGKTLVSPSIEAKLRDFLNILSVNSEAIIMVSSGILLAKLTIKKNILLTNTDYTNLFLIFLMTYLIRAVVLIVHYPILLRTGYRLSFKELIFACFAGMKGVISITIASLAREDTTLNLKEQALMSYFGIGIPLLCIAVGGMATRILATVLGLQRLSQAEENVLIGATCAIVENTRNQMEYLKEDKEYRLADWTKVSNLVGTEDLIKEVIRKTEGLRKRYKKENSVIDNLLNHHNRISLTNSETTLEIRKRFLSTLKGTYWERFKSGLCSGMSAVVLTSSVNYSLDRVSEPLKDWKYLKNHIHKQRLINLLEKLAKFKCFSHYFRKILLKEVILMYQSVTSFIQCHQATINLFHQFELDYNKVAFKTILKEVDKQVNKCKVFMNLYIIDCYPEIISEVQTQMCCKILLLEQRKIVEEIYAQGVIKELEYEKLVDALDSSIKTAVFKGIPQIPEFKDIIRNRFKEPSDEEIENLVQKMTETVYQPGQVIFREGEVVEGAYLVISGRIREYSDWIDQELVIGNIVGVQHLIEEFSERSTTTAEVITQTSVSLIPKSIINSPAFLKELFTEAAEEILLINRKKYDLLNTTFNHVCIVVAKSVIKLLETGQKISLLSGGLVLQGKFNKKIENWVLKPRVKKWKALDVCVVLCFPEDFLFYFKEDVDLGNAFTRYCTQMVEKESFSSTRIGIRHKRTKTADVDQCESQLGLDSNKF